MFSQLHTKKFNDKVKIMNDSASRQLVLTAKEARDLHSEIFNMIEYIAVIQAALIEKSVPKEGEDIIYDGGKF